MSKVFEYKIINAVPKSSTTVEKLWLDKLGSEGWELVNVVNSPFFRYYLKREVEDTTKESKKDGNKEEPKSTSGSGN